MSAGAESGTAPLDDAALLRALSPHLARARLVELFGALVRRPSPLTALAEAEPLIRAFIGEAVAPVLRAAGLAPRRDAMGNLIAGLGADRTGRSLLLVGHAMTQPPATMADPYSGTLVDGRPHGLAGAAVRGKGASEQKGTLAAMLHAIEAVVASGLPITGRLAFLCLVSGESGKHDAIRHVVEVEGVRAELGFVYGNGLRTQLGNRGRVDLTAVVRGTPCHSSRPRSGANAVTGAVELLRRLDAAFGVPAVHPQLGEAWLTCNGVHSHPESSHTVQDRCEVSLDRRLLPGDDPDAAAAAVADVAAGMAGWADPVSGRPLTVEIVRGPAMYPSLVAPESRVVRLLDAACTAVFGAPRAPFHGGSAHDQGYLNHMGIETVNFGSGEEHLAHTDDDMGSVDAAFDAARIYAWMIARYLGPGA